MLKNIGVIIVLTILVWYFDTILEVILPIPTESMVEGFLNLDINWHYNIFKFLRYIVWIIFLGLVFKYTRPLLSFLLPLSRQFSTTKPVRRFHGIMTELMIFGLAFMIFGIFIAANPARKAYKDTIESEKQRIESGIDNTFLNNRSEIKTAIKTNRIKALDYLYNSANTYDVYEGIWPMDDSKTIEAYSASEEFPLTKRFKNWAFGDDSKSDIRFTSQYQSYFKKQKKAFAQLKSIENVRIDSKSKLDKSAKESARQKLGNPILFILSYYKNKLWWLLGFSFLAYILFHYFIRSGLGRGYESILHFYQQGRFGIGGSSRFAGIFEEWLLQFKKQKYALYMGRSLYNPFRNIGLKDARHMLTIAANRAGKGASVIITNLLLWRGSTLVIDPKGTNAIVTARQRRAMGQDVYLIDPFGITGQETASINVLSMLDPDSPTIREELMRIAEALVIHEENEGKHWSDGAKTVIAGMLAHLITSPKYENPNLTILRDMISMLPEPQAELWAEMSLNQKAGKLARDAANRIIRGIHTDEITNILSNADKHTEWLTSPAMEKTLSSNSFNFKDLKDKPTTVYLILPPNELSTHNRFLRLFINLALNQMSIGGKAKIPVLMMMDEFQALGKMQEVEKAFPLMAGYNLVMWPFVQSLEGLRRIYGKEGADTFLSNSRAIQVFGVDGGATKEFVSQHIGEIALKSQKGRVVKLRTPSEASMDVSAESGRQYILRGGKPPLILEKVPYYRSAPLSFLKWMPFFKGAFKGVFAGKYDPDPDYT